MTARHLERLRPHVAALPVAGPVNVNTATPEVLAALSATLTLDEAYTLAARRNQTYFRNAADLRNALDGKQSMDERQVGFASQYFLVTAQAVHERIALQSQALFERSGRRVPRLIWRVVQ